MPYQSGDNNFSICKWIVDASLGHGTHQTLTAALASASSGDTIGIRAGNTLTENCTMKAGVNVIGLPGDGFTPNATIIGTLSCSYSGTATVSNLRLQTNSANAISLTGANATILNILNCNLNFTNADGISSTGSNSAATITVNNCSGDLGTTGIKIFNVTNGSIGIYYSNFTNTGASTTASTHSGTNLSMRYSFFLSPFTTSGSTSQAGLWSVDIDTSTINATAFTNNGTNAASSNFYNVSLKSGTATPLSIGASSTLTSSNLALTSSNAASIAGSGTFITSDVHLLATAGTIAPTVTAKSMYVGPISFDNGTNTMAAYEVGNWTPTITGSGSNPTPTYTTQVGRYIKVGKLVYVTCTIQVSALTGGTGNFEISGLPYTTQNTTNHQATFSGIYVSTTVSRLIGLANPNATKIGFLYAGDGSAGSFSLPQTTTTQINISGCYQSNT